MRLIHARLLNYFSFMASTETEGVSLQFGPPSYLVSLTETEEVSAQSEAESSSSSASSSGDSTYQVSAKSVSDSSSSNSNESDSEILVDEVIAKRPRLVIPRTTNIYQLRLHSCRLLSPHQ